MPIEMLMASKSDNTARKFSAKALMNALIASNFRVTVSKSLSMASKYLIVTYTLFIKNRWHL